ncbi:hypothetical protein Tco_0545665, partial [Tanacetum coccineum]
DLRSIETEFLAIVFNDALTSEVTLSCEPMVSPLNDHKIDFRTSFDESDDEDYTDLAANEFDLMRKDSSDREMTVTWHGYSDGSVVLCKWAKSSQFESALRCARTFIEILWLVHDAVVLQSLTG